tara:strand:- start:37 stop:1269 length:1233 start_codon:yes stop_codon:yes gene_type:complete
MLQSLLNDRHLLCDDEAPRPMESLHRNRCRQVHTLFGTITLTRNYYYHCAAQSGRCPLDELLDLTRGYTPALTRIICRASACSGSYQQGAQDLLIYTGLSLESRNFGRLVHSVTAPLEQALATLPPEDQNLPKILYVSNDGTGLPCRRAELQGRAGKQPDGTARTREAKLGCVFTQTSTDENGQPLRDVDSTSYVGTLEDCREIGTLLRQEALRRGYAGAGQTVFLGDGAPWVWENARLNFPGAVEILDFYHASEHLGELTAALWGRGSEKAAKHQEQWSSRMKHSSASKVMTTARRLLKQRREELSPEQIEILEREINYFDTHAERTRYQHFREQGFFIGSGVIEAGCKTIVGKRMKQSGMFWGEQGGEDLLKLRCLILGPHFDAAWTARRDILETQRQEKRRWSPSLN